MAQRYARLRSVGGKFYLIPTILIARAGRTVTSDVDYLIAADPTARRGDKLIDARRKDIPILTEAEFREMLDNPS